MYTMGNITVSVATAQQKLRVVIELIGSLAGQTRMQLVGSITHSLVLKACPTDVATSVHNPLAWKGDFGACSIACLL